MTMLPRVSVIMPTYNHEKFVRAAIDSVLAQEGVDFEFLISDDGSRDATREVVASVSDERIRFFPNTVNRGACVVTNELVQASRGEFVALLNSDDMWLPGKLAEQVRLMDSRPGLGATFGRARFIDRDAFPIAKSGLPFGTIFDQANRNQGEWLRRFFDLGNCICHPTMLIRRRCYDEVGLYSNRLRQLPDFEMWIRLIKRYPIHIVEKDLIDFRILPGENASSDIGPNARRTINEHFLLAERFFDAATREQLIEGFSDVLHVPSIPSEAHLRIEGVLQLMRPNQWLGAPYRMTGLSKLRELLDDDSLRAILASDYNIDDRWFQARMSEHEALMPRPPALQPEGRKQALRRAAGLAWRAFVPSRS
ncbi:glycosyltransferase [Dyella subtropica]|uniref:glycosyltransferase n=1 Tax=Dyella subtropica TaxID=2992127 RepID=UPI002257D436|nr:glycosyltransferase [Dyella subtropica]